MFCGKCGAQNPDGTAFCAQCGAPLNDGKPAPAAGGSAVAAPAEDKHRLIGIAAVGIVALAAIILIIVLVSGRSANSTAKSFIKAVFSGDSDDIVDLIPDDYIKTYADEYGMKVKEAKDEIADSFEDQFEGASEMLEDLKVTVKVSGSEEYDEDELDDIVDAYKDYDVKVKDAKIVSVLLTLKYEGEKLELDDPLDIPVIKVGGSWYLDMESFGSSFLNSIMRAFGSALLG